MFKIRKALVVLLTSTTSVISSEVALAHAGLEASSMTHISLHAGLAVGIGAVFVFAGVMLNRRLKKEQIKK